MLIFHTEYKHSRSLSILYCKINIFIEILIYFIKHMCIDTYIIIDKNLMRCFFIIFFWFLSGTDVRYHLDWFCCEFLKPG